MDLAAGVQGQLAGTFGALTLFPGSSLIQSALAGLTVSYDFNLGRLGFGVADFSLKLKDLLFRGFGVSLNPGLPVLAQIGSLKLTLPQFPGLGAADLGGFELTPAGFSVGRFEWKVPEAAFGTAIKGVDFSVVGSGVDGLGRFVVDLAAGVQGQLAGTFGALVLFPDNLLLKSSFSGLSIHYDFTAGQLLFQASKFQLDIGEAFSLISAGLVFRAGGVAGEPLAEIGSAMLRSTQFTGLGVAMLSGLKIFDDGLTLGSATLAQPEGVTARIGDFLAFTELSVKLENFRIKAGAGAEGKITVSAGGLRFFPEAAAIRSVVQGAQGEYVFRETGGFDLEIQLPAFTLEVGQAIKLAGAGATLTPGHETILSLAEAALSSPAMPQAGQITLQNLAIRRDGFSLDDFTLGVAGGETVTPGGAVALANFRISGRQFSYTAGSFTGSLSAAADSVTLFPQSRLLHTQATGLALSCDLAGTGDLKAHLDQLSLAVGEAVELTATGVDLYPGREVVASLAQVEMRAARIPSLAPVTLAQWVIRSDGFDLGRAVLAGAAGAVVNLGAAVQLTGASLAVEDFSLRFGAGETLSGQITLSASGAALYPGSPLIHATLEQFRAYYDFDNGGGLRLAAGGLLVQVGQSFGFEAHQVALTPGSGLLATIGEAAVRLPGVEGLGALTLAGIRLYGDRLELGSAVLKQAAGTAASFGDYLELRGLSLTLRDFTVPFASGGVSGSLEFAADSVALYPRAAFLAVSVTGFAARFDWGHGGALSLHLGGLVIDVGEALRLEAGGFDLAPDEPDVLATIGRVAVSSPKLPGLGGAELADFKLRRSGFEIGSLAWKAGQEIQFGTAVALQGLSLQAAHLGVNYGGQPSVAGALEITAAAARLFPAAPAIRSSLKGLSLAFDFENALGALVISVDQFGFQVGEALSLDGGKVVLTPGAGVVATVRSARITSGLLANFGDATVENLVIRRDGFDLGSLAIRQAAGSTANIGQVLAVAGGVLTVTAFRLQIGEAAEFSGAITLAVGEATLYPEMKNVATRLEGAVASFSFSGGGLGEFRLGSSRLVVDIASALRVEALQVVIEPGSADVLAAIQVATVSSPQFAGLQPGRIENLVLRRGGFSLGSLELGQLPEFPVTIGDFLRMDGVKLFVEDFSVDISGKALGSIRLEIGRLELFPKCPQIKSIFSGFNVFFDFSLPIPALNIGIGSFQLDIGEAFSLRAFDVNLTPDFERLLHLDKITLSAPKIPGLRAIDLGDFSLFKTGFSIGSMELRLPDGLDTAMFGSVLRIARPVLRLERFQLAYGSLPRIDASIKLEAASLQLFPGVSFLDSELTGITGEFDFSEALGSLKLTVGNFRLDVGQALRLAATGIELTPGRLEIARIGSLKAFSPVFEGLAPLELKEVVFRQDGFTLGSFELAQIGGGQVKLGAAMAIDTLALRVSNFALAFDAAGASIGGAITLSASGLQLYPGSGLIQSEILNPSGTFDFTGAGRLHFQAGLLRLKIATDALVLEAAGVQLDPLAGLPDPIATIPTLAARSPRFTNLPGATVTNLRIFGDGVAIGSVTFQQPAGAAVRVGGVLEFTGLEVAVRDLVYRHGSAAAMDGDITVKAGSAKLFPGNSSFTAAATGLAGSFNLATGALAIQAGSFHFQFGSVIEITAEGVQLDPGADIVARLATVQAWLPGLQAGATATGFEVSRSGCFSVVSLTVDVTGLNGRFSVGHFLPFELEALTVHFLGDSNGNGQRDPGEVYDLTAFDLTAAGHFDFEKMKASLPFTPILAIGEGASATVADSPASKFTFTLTFANGGITPKDLGPITIGFADLKVGQAAVLGGTITLGGYQDGRWSSQFGGAVELKQSAQVTGVTGAAATLAGTFDEQAGRLAASGTLGVSFVLGGSAQVTDARLIFSLVLAAQGDGGFSLEMLRLDGFDIGQVTIKVGDALTLVGKKIALDFNPRAGGNIATFGSLAATLNNLGITGAARNFGISAEGRLAALPGFAVALEVSDPGKLKWPAWLPIKITAIGLAWPDFNRDLADFQIVFSAVATSINGLKGLTVEGVVEGVVIDIGLLGQGQFPIVDIRGVGVKVGGSAFGGRIEGALFLGIVKLDAAGKLIDDLDTTTPARQRVLYGGIQAEFQLAGISGFRIQFGLSELGPLQIYFRSGAVIVLDPVSGLALKDLRGGVDFNRELPAVNTPFDLRGAAFKPAGELTLEEWKNQLKDQVVQQAQSPGQDSWGRMDAPMVIQAGATLFSLYTSPYAFVAEVDLLIGTDGKFVINAKMVFGKGTPSELRLNGLLYADFGDTNTATKIFFLVDEPGGQPVMTLFGSVQFLYARNDGLPVDQDHPSDIFQIRIQGGLQLTAMGFLNVTISGQVTLTFGDHRFDLDLIGSVNLSFIGDTIGVAGRLHFDNAGPTLRVWGALAMTPNFSLLEKLGLYVDGVAVWRLNLTGETLAEKLDIPGRGEQTFELKPKSSSVLVDGWIIFRQGGKDWFRLQGLHGCEMSQDGLDVFTGGVLVIGPPDSPLLGFKYSGYFRIAADGAAGKIAALLETNLPESFQAELGGGFLVVFNTTGRAVEYLLPAGIAEAPGGGLDRRIVIGAGPSAAGAGQPYLRVDASGYLRLATLRLEGAFKMLVAPEVLSVEANADLKLKAGEVELFSFHFAGGLRIDSQGVAAVIELGRDFRLPDGLGFTFGASLKGRLEVNTTGEALTLAGVSLAAERYALVRLQGQLTILPAFLLEGEFELTAGTGGVAMRASADLVLQAAGVTFYKYQVRGGLEIDALGLVAALEISEKQGLPDFGLKYEFRYRLEINTTGEERTVAGFVLEKDMTARVAAAGALQILGLVMDGVFQITLGADYLQLEAEARLRVDVAGWTLFDFQVAGGLRVGAKGVAAEINLALNAGVPAFLGFSLEAAYQLQVNTTREAVQLGAVSLEAGYYGRLRIDGTLTVAGFQLQGRFRLTAGGLEVRLEGQAQLRLEVAGTVLLKFDADASLAINEHGIAAAFGLSLSQNLPAGFGSFSGQFAVRINTTGQAVKVEKAGVDLEAGSYGKVLLDGQVSVLGFVFQGHAEIQAGNDGFLLWGNLSFMLFSVQLTTRIDLALMSDGLAARFLIDTDLLDVAVGGVPLFTLRGSFNFKLNTTGRWVFGIAPATALVFVQDARLTILGLTMRGSLSIGVQNGIFQIVVPADDPLALDFYGIADIQVYGYVRGNGRFNITGVVAVHLGRDDLAAISGLLALTVSDSGIAVALHGKIIVFSQAILTVDGSVSVTGSGFRLVGKARFNLPDVLDFISLEADLDLAVDQYGIALGLAGSVDLWGFLKGSVGGWIRTGKEGSWFLHGQAGFSIGGGNLGANGNVVIDVGYLATPQTVFGADRGAGLHTGLWLNGGAWAGFSVAGYWIGASVGLSGNVDVHSGTASVEVSGSIDLWLDSIDWSRTIHLQFKNGFGIYLSDVAGSLVFLDVNKNGALDAGEPFTYADANGRFTFDDAAAAALAGESQTPFARLDADQDGFLDYDEGRVLLTGGFALATGQANALTIALPEGQLSGLAGCRDATVFVDVNGNGQLDSGEYSVRSGADGVFSLVGVLLPAPALDPAQALGNDLAPFDANRNGSLEKSEGRFVLAGGTVIQTGAAQVSQVLADNSPSGFTGVRGGTVFFDANQNGIRDAGEPSTPTADDGRFSFLVSAVAGNSSALGLLAPYDRNGNGLLDAGEGQLYAVGGYDAKGQPVAGLTIVKDNLAAGCSPVRQPERIFLDANGNGKYDAATELSTNPDPQGYYSFAGFTLGSLGQLKKYDLNGNGIIDPAEGVFRIVGGQDTGNSQVERNRIESTPAGYATGLRQTANPCSQVRLGLLDPLVAGQTLSAAEADRLVELSFGLPLWTEIGTFDPRTAEADGRNTEILTAATQIGNLVAEGAALLQGAASGNIPTEKAQGAIFSALARRAASLKARLDAQPVENFRTLSDPDPATQQRRIVGGAPWIDLTDPAVVQAILADASALLKADPALRLADAALLDRPATTNSGGTAARLGAYGAAVIAAHNAYARQAGLGPADKLSFTLARLKEFTQTIAADALKKLGARETALEEADLAVNGAALGRFMGQAGLALAAPNREPVLLTPLPGLAAKPGQAVALPVAVYDWDGAAREVAITLVGSSDPKVVNPATFSVTGTGLDRVLRFTASGALGAATDLVLRVDDDPTADPNGWNETRVAFRVSLVASPAPPRDFVPAGGILVEPVAAAGERPGRRAAPAGGMLEFSRAAPSHRLLQAAPRRWEPGRERLAETGMAPHATLALPDLDPASVTFNYD